MLTLYSMPSSGNSYKVRLLLNQLGIGFEHIDCEYSSGATTSDWFRAKNPNGKVPLLELEDGRLIAESNAILLYLAQGSSYLPVDLYDLAKVHEWLFFEQNFHEGTIATRQAIFKYEQRAHLRTPEHLDPLLVSGHRALGVMEAQLEKTPFIAGNDYTIADIALYAYTHTAGEIGKFEMERFPFINKWLSNVSKQTHHVTLDWLPAT
ncbi:glutathione S-transferase family protein [Ahrensia kielensis]|uniref:glutathione S-transferase family protein n=1 Tax=Ahrensia kielensis TaxID=76980 RepID=UPI00039A105B|nr:glutathione S-transferase family protein [Ahrensia kielensis]